MPVAKSPMSLAYNPAGSQMLPPDKAKTRSGRGNASARSLAIQVPRTNTRNPERTSAAILAAAVKEFTEKGYEGARIDSIADRAGVNKRMLYHYFGNKQALYVAVLENSYTAIRTAEHGLHLSDRDPVDGMTDLVLFTWRYYLAHPEFLSLLNTENLHRAKFLKRSGRIFELNSPLIEQISVLLKRGVDQGVFRDAPGSSESLRIDRRAWFFLLVKPLDAIHDLSPRSAREGKHRGLGTAHGRRHSFLSSQSLTSRRVDSLCGP